MAHVEDRDGPDQTPGDPRSIPATRLGGYAASTEELEDGTVTQVAPVIVDGRAVAAFILFALSFRG